MTAKFLKIMVLAVGLAAFSYMLGTRAQSIGGRSVTGPVTTNWVGRLVIGKGDAMDRIARGNKPTTVDPVEIGLRSDGVVVWRSVSED